MEEILKKIKNIRSEVLEMNEFFKDKDYDLWCTYCDLTVIVNNMYIMINKELGGRMDVYSK